MPVAQRLLDTTDRAFRLIVSDSWLAGLLRTEGARPDRGVRDELRADPEVRVSHRFADRHPLPLEPLSQIARRLAGERAARGRPLPVAAAQVRRRRAGRGSLPQVRRYAFQSDRRRAGVARTACPGLGDLLRVHVVPDDPANDAELCARGIPAAVVLSAASRRPRRTVRGASCVCRASRNTSPRTCASGIKAPERRRCDRLRTPVVCSLTHSRGGQIMRMIPQWPGNGSFGPTTNLKGRT